jgi:hypothetical protein
MMLSEAEAAAVSAALLSAEADLAGRDAVCAVCAGRWVVDARFHDWLLTGDAALVVLWLEAACGFVDTLPGLLHWRHAEGFFAAHPGEDRAVRLELARVVLRGARAQQELFEVTEHEQVVSLEAQSFLDAEWGGGDPDDPDDGLP